MEILKLAKMMRFFSSQNRRNPLSSSQGHYVHIENVYYRNKECLDDMFRQLGLRRWQYVNARARRIRRVVTERAREERQNIRDSHTGPQENLEDALAAVDNHDDDSVVIEDLEMEETLMRQRGLLSDEPEDRNRPGYMPEGERSLTPRRRTRQAAGMPEAAGRNQRRRGRDNEGH